MKYGASRTRFITGSTAMGGEDPQRHGQAKAAVAYLGGEKRFDEQPRSIIFANAGTFVGDA